MKPSKLQITPTFSIPLEELTFHFSRSSGPGGQHVNRTQSRVELRFDLAGSPSLSTERKQVLLSKLRPHLDGEGVLHLFVQAHRSQAHNRRLALQRFVELLQKAVQPRKPRKATSPSAGSKRRRLEAKRRRSRLKQDRRTPAEED